MKKFILVLVLFLVVGFTPKAFAQAVAPTDVPQATPVVQDPSPTSPPAVSPKVSPSPTAVPSKTPEESVTPTAVPKDVSPTPTKTVNTPTPTPTSTAQPTQASNGPTATPQPQVQAASVKAAPTPTPTPAPLFNIPETKIGDTTVKQVIRDVSNNAPIATVLQHVLPKDFYGEQNDTRRTIGLSLAGVFFVIAGLLLIIFSRRTSRRVANNFHQKFNYPAIPA